MNIKKLLVSLLVIPLIGCIIFCGYLSWIATHHVILTILYAYISYFVLVCVVLGVILSIYLIVEKKHRKDSQER